MAEPQELAIANDVILANLNALESTVRNFRYSQTVRDDWSRIDNEDERRNVEQAAMRNLRDVQANMLDGITIARGYAASNDWDNANVMLQRLTSRWRRWLRQYAQISRSAESRESERTFLADWTDSLRRNALDAADSAAQAAEDVTDALSSTGLAVGAAVALVLYFRSRRR